MSTPNASPAQPQGVPAGPVSFKSRPAMLLALGLSGILLVGCAMLWIGLGSERAAFTFPQVLTLGSFVLVIIAVMLSVGLSQLTATPEGVSVRNGLKTTRYRWDQLAGVSFGAGDPFAYLQIKAPSGDPDDNESHMVLAMQRAEGDAVLAKIERLRAMITAANQER